MIDSLAVAEIISRLDSIQPSPYNPIWNIIIPVISTLLGSFLVLYFANLRFRKEREDKYKLFLAEKRFIVMQEAFTYCGRWIYCKVLDENEIKEPDNLTLYMDMDLWFSRNNLYLFPLIRKKISTMLLAIGLLLNYKEKQLTKLVNCYIEVEEFRKITNNVKNSNLKLANDTANEIISLIDNYYNQTIK